MTNEAYEKLTKVGRTIVGAYEEINTDVTIDYDGFRFVMSDYSDESKYADETDMIKDILYCCEEWHKEDTLTEIMEDLQFETVGDLVGYLALLP